MSRELVTFLEARITEDADAAQTSIASGPEWVVEAESYGAHPRRDLRECDAKRKVIALYKAVPELDRDDPDARFNDGWRQGISTAMEILALPYRDHPDYQEEWPL